MIQPEAVAAGRWWPRSSFKHFVGQGSDLLGLGDTGGFAVSFSPLRNDRVELRLEGWQSPQLSVWRTVNRVGFESGPRVAADVAVVRFVTCGQVHRSEFDGAIDSGAGVATLNVFETMRSERFSDGFASVTVAMSRAALQHAVCAIDEDDNRSIADLEPLVDLNRRPIYALLRAARFLHAGGAQSVLDHPAGLLLLQDVFANHLASVWPRRANLAQSPRRPSVSRRTLSRALEFLEAHAQSAITLSDIAAAAGVSVRSLQIAFKLELHTTPLSYLIALRLDGVRRDLLARSTAPLSIRQAAATWGFDHQGDFNRRYRARFGETPSDTVRRRR